MHLQILLCTTLKPVIAIGALILPSTIYSILKVLPLSHLSWQCDVFGLMYLGWCLTFWTCKAYSVCSMYCSCFYWCAVYELTSDLLACVLKKGVPDMEAFCMFKIGSIAKYKVVYIPRLLSLLGSLQYWTYDQVSNRKESRCWRKQCLIFGIRSGVFDRSSYSSFRRERTPWFLQSLTIPCYFWRIC